MDKFIRCLKESGQVVGSSFEEKPADLPHTMLFWVRVPSDAPIYNQFPVPYCAEDKVYFILNTPLTDEELTARNLIKELDQGYWNHDLSEEQASLSNKEEQIKLIDAETYKLVKEWCAHEVEGCEEAFLALGIEDRNNDRYITYMQQKAAIKNQQSAKKAALV